MNSNYRSPEQECVLLQPDVGIDDNDEETTSKVQADVRETNKEAAAAKDDSLVDRAKQAVRPGASDSGIITFLKREMFAACTVLLVFPLVLVYFLLLNFSYLVRIFSKHVRKAIGAIGMY